VLSYPGLVVHGDGTVAISHDGRYIGVAAVVNTAPHVHTRTETVPAPPGEQGEPGAPPVTVTRQTVVAQPPRVMHIVAVLSLEVLNLTSQLMLHTLVPDAPF
jgi:hypothetical protein